MKQNIKVITLVLLVLFCTALLATGTFAAYTSVESVKRVVTTKSASSELCFSSNYLEETEKINPTYAEKIITANDTGFIIKLDIYNFPKSDGTKFSQVDITYVLAITLIANDDTVSNITEAEQVNSLLTLEPSSPSVIGSHTITTGSAKTDSYTISCNDNAKLKLLQNYKIRITATPQNVYQEKMLAADFKLVTTSQSTDWSGNLIEFDSPGSYDAFNYEIHGTALETKVLTWDPAQVALSPWSLKDLPVVGSYTPTSGSAELELGGDGKPTSYLLQFYKVNDFNGTPSISLGNSSSAP